MEVLFSLALRALEEHKQSVDKDLTSLNEMIEKHKDEVIPKQEFLADYELFKGRAFKYPDKLPDPIPVLDILFTMTRQIYVLTNRYVPSRPGGKVPLVSVYIIQDHIQRYLARINKEIEGINSLTLAGQMYYMANKHREGMESNE